MHRSKMLLAALPVFAAQASALYLPTGAPQGPGQLVQARGELDAGERTNPQPFRAGDSASDNNPEPQITAAPHFRGRRDVNGITILTKESGRVWVYDMPDDKPDLTVSDLVAEETYSDSTVTQSYQVTMDPRTIEVPEWAAIATEEPESTGLSTEPEDDGTTVYIYQPFLTTFTRGPAHEGDESTVFVYQPALTTFTLPEPEPTPVANWGEDDDVVVVFDPPESTTTIYWAATPGATTKEEDHVVVVLDPPESTTTIHPHPTVHVKREDDDGSVPVLPETTTTVYQTVTRKPTSVEEIHISFPSGQSTYSNRVPKSFETVLRTGLSKTSHISQASLTPVPEVRVAGPGPVVKPNAVPYPTNPHTMLNPVIPTKNPFHPNSMPTRPDHPKTMSKVVRREPEPATNDTNRTQPDDDSSHTSVPLRCYENHNSVRHGKGDQAATAVCTFGTSNLPQPGLFPRHKFLAIGQHSEYICQPGRTHVEGENANNVIHCRDRCGQCGVIGPGRDSVTCRNRCGYLEQHDKRDDKRDEEEEEEEPAFVFSGVSQQDARAGIWCRKGLVLFHGDEMCGYPPHRPVLQPRLSSGAAEEVSEVK
ncbi:hypothetical protein GE09DRAFT_1222476 [Coniochaeta sp. 2T2.1]|nr:hypothetical protein GE09DRAFT_1222476 [Coniochaeta sp. 2T2.1]